MFRMLFHCSQLTQKLYWTLLKKYICIMKLYIFYTHLAHQYGKWLIIWVYELHVREAVSYMCCFRLPSITFHTKLTLKKVSQSCWLLQQVKVMCPALAYCSLLIALCSSWPIDFMVSRGLLRLIRMDSRVFAFWQPFSRRFCNCEKPL